jgi:phage terminase large subunit-like protein
MASFTPDTLDSPDRVDALVWALTDLLLGGHHGAAAF